MPAALNETFEGNTFIANSLDPKKEKELESPTDSDTIGLNTRMVGYEIGKNVFNNNEMNYNYFSPWWNHTSTSGESPDTSTPSPSPYGTGVGQFNYDTSPSGHIYVPTSRESPDKSTMLIYGNEKDRFNFDCSPTSNYASTSGGSPEIPGSIFDFKIGKQLRSKYPSISVDSTDMNGLYARYENESGLSKYDMNHSPGSNYASTSGESQDISSPQPYGIPIQSDFDMNYSSRSTSEESPCSSDSTPTKQSLHSSYCSDSPGSESNNIFDIQDLDQLCASLNEQQVLNIRNLFVVNTLVDRVNQLISSANGVTDSSDQAVRLLQHVMCNDRTIVNAQKYDTKYLETAARFHRTAAVSGLHDITHTWSGELPTRSQKLNGFSNKVFLGGVPYDISEEVLVNSFKRFGHIDIEWPGKDRTAHAKGYVYVIFESENQVKSLLDFCTYNPMNGGTWHYKLSTRRLKLKEVQVIPWTMSDSNYNVKGHTQKLEVHRTIFVGALHGMMNAEALYKVMNELFGGVLYAGIDTDKHKYPIGSGRVTFTNEQSYARAVTAAFVEVRTPKFTKKIQLDPYLEENPCSICTIQTGPYFCRDKSCHRYYCKGCWERYHSQMYLPHKPMMRNSKSAILSNRNYVQHSEHRRRQ